MKKAILLIAATLLLCSAAKAQYMADASSLRPLSQINLAENQQAVKSIYSVPMPETDLMVNNQYTTEQLASRKGWGIACIITGGLTMLSSASVWVFGGMFNQAASSMPSDFADDPDMQEGQQAVQAVGNGVKTIGIIGTVTGAALVGTGIWLVSSDGNSGSHGRHGRRGGRSRRHRRYSEAMPTIEPIQPDWALSLNVGPTNAGLTLVF